MLVSDTIVLTYCLNIFPIKRADDVFVLFENTIPELKRKLGLKEYDQFPLGIWFPNNILEELMRKKSLLVRLMNQHNLVIATMNAFPFGVFHGERVKEKVYYPDWGERERLKYTKKLVELTVELPRLERILPISTVPVTFGNRMPEKALEYIFEMVDFLEDIHNTYEQKFTLMFEPEPFCFLENQQQTLDFFKKLHKVIPKSKTFTGVCLDTCHSAVVFEDPLEQFLVYKDHDIRVDKIQISSSIVLPAQSDKQALKKYIDQVYFHQTFVKRDEKIYRFVDLDKAVALGKEGEYRVHYHIPLHTQPISPLKSSVENITHEFFQTISQEERIIEVETYTFDVLPTNTESVLDSIIKELQWVTKRI